MVGQILKITVPADSGYVGMARTLVSTLLERLGVVPEDVYDATLVLGEICSNVVRHAYQDPRETYSVSVELLPQGVAFTVRDCGRGLDRHAVQEPDLHRPNGWGVWLIEHFSARTTMRPLEPHGTEVRSEIRLRCVRKPPGGCCAPLDATGCVAELENDDEVDSDPACMTG